MKNRKLLLVILLVLVFATACSLSGPESQTEPFVISAIPDQYPEQLQRLYSKLERYLEEQLDVPVIYRPVNSYVAAVTAFKTGDLDMVWFGALTGVQVRLQVPSAEAILQRDIDRNFHSVFIAHSSSGLEPIEHSAELITLKGHSFTFGSESSTSGRLMPQYYLEEEGVSLHDFAGEVGFSSSHDTLIKLVEAGTYDVGSVNEQVWLSRVESGEVDTDRVAVIWRTPPYYNYHWVINTNVSDRYGTDFVDQVRVAFLELDLQVEEHKEILELFGATKFVVTENANYIQIENIARRIGLIR